MNDPWQLDASAPELYERYLVPAITAKWAADLVARVAPEPGEHLLDVACGTGIVARQAAERMRSGRVVGLDINGAMLAVARSLPNSSGVAIEWREGSALATPFADGSFDIVLCQLGLQFFPDRAAALGEMWRVLEPGGRLALSVYTRIENTPVADALARALDRHLGPGASDVKRSEHSLADAEELRELVSNAGFREVTIATAIQTIEFPSPRDYVRLQIEATPMARLLDGMAPEAREAIVDAITDDLTWALRPSVNGALASPQEANIAVGRK